MGTPEKMVDDAGVVRIGSVVFALIRPSPGRERAFNRWYERDHYYTAGTAAPGVFSAGRFIEPTSGWHLALYFVLPGHDPARVAFATEQVQLSAADDRLFTDREHLHTWSCVVASAHGGSDGVPLALALDHRYPGLRVSIVDDVAPSPVAPALVLAPRSEIMASDWLPPDDPAGRRIVLEFAPGPASEPDRGAVWSGDFLPVVFGTDTHVSSGTAE